MPPGVRFLRMRGGILTGQRSPPLETFARRLVRDRPQLRLSPALRTVGYRQVWRFLDGDFDQAELLARLQAATRQVAKRQLSWLRHWDGLAATAPDADALLARMWGA